MGRGRRAGETRQQRTSAFRRLDACGRAPRVAVVASQWRLSPAKVCDRNRATWFPTTLRRRCHERGGLHELAAHTFAAGTFAHDLPSRFNFSASWSVSSRAGDQQPVVASQWIQMPQAMSDRNVRGASTSGAKQVDLKRVDLNSACEGAQHGIRL